MKLNVGLPVGIVQQLPEQAHAINKGAARPSKGGHTSTLTQTTLSRSGGCLLLHGSPFLCACVPMKCSLALSWCKMPKISFACFLTTATVLLALAPSVLIWFILSGVMNSSLQMLEQTTVDSVVELSVALQHKFLDEALQLLMVRLGGGDRAIATQINFVKGNRFPLREFLPKSRPPPKSMCEEYGIMNFAFLKGNELFSQIAVRTLHFPSGPSAGGLTTWWQVWQAMHFNVGAKMGIGVEDFNRTIYRSELCMEPNETLTRFQVFCPFPRHRSCPYRSDHRGTHHFPAIPIWGTVNAVRAQHD